MVSCFLLAYFYGSIVVTLASLHVQLPRAEPVLMPWKPKACNAIVLPPLDSAYGKYSLWFDYARWTGRRVRLACHTSSWGARCANVCPYNCTAAPCIGHVWGDPCAQPVTVSAETMLFEPRYPGDTLIIKLQTGAGDCLEQMQTQRIMFEDLKQGILDPHVVAVFHPEKSWHRFLTAHKYQRFLHGMTVVSPDTEWPSWYAEPSGLRRSTLFRVIGEIEKMYPEQDWDIAPETYNIEQTRRHMKNDSKKTQSGQLRERRKWFCKKDHAPKAAGVIVVDSDVVQNSAKSFSARSNMDTNNTNEDPLKNVDLCQREVKSHLVFGHHCHIRLHAMVTNWLPFRAYIHKNIGIVHFSITQSHMNEDSREQDIPRSRHAQQHTEGGNNIGSTSFFRFSDSGDSQHLHKRKKRKIGVSSTQDEGLVERFQWPLHELKKYFDGLYQRRTNARHNHNATSSGKSETTFSYFDRFVWPQLEAVVAKALIATFYQLWEFKSMSNGQATYFEELWRTDKNADLQQDWNPFSSQWHEASSIYNRMNYILGVDVILEDATLKPRLLKVQVGPDISEAFQENSDNFDVLWTDSLNVFGLQPFTVPSGYLQHRLVHGARLADESDTETAAQRAVVELREEWYRASKTFWKPLIPARRYRNGSAVGLDVDGYLPRNVNFEMLAHSNYTVIGAVHAAMLEWLRGAGSADVNGYTSHERSEL